MKFSSAVIALCLYSSSILALAGGTMVGNGGGFAEMQAVHLDALLPQYLSNKQEYQKFLLFLKRDDRPALAFVKRCLSLNDSDLQPEVIPSCHLYSDQKSSLGPRPLDATRIGALVFAVRWMAWHPNDNWDVALANGLTLFSTTEIKVNSIPLTWQSGVIASLNIWSVVDSTDTHPLQQITFELPEVSLDIRADLQAATRCDSDELLIDVAYMSSQRASKGRIYAIGPVRWTCGLEALHGELHLSYRGSEEAPQIKATIRKIQPL